MRTTSKESVCVGGEDGDIYVVMKQRYTLNKYSFIQEVGA